MNSAFLSHLSGSRVAAPLSLSRLSALLVLLTVALLPASAVAAGDLRIGLVAEKVISTVDGTEVFDTQSPAQPGDVIQYTAVYRNTGDGHISNLAPVLPIPEGMRCDLTAASPAPAEASLDGKTFVPMAEAVAALKADNSRVVRALRWHVAQLDAGSSATVVARASLNKSR
ncbi:hypothetical protein [Synoicihabitans lomoniglobus]|uniref:DUF11 domain-containing protein n=1 Tax=Synoicihabitans lomoniglobus TaxID=2909285 RepID=A0AAE9ZX35_9BACT|nr:hypothetical protein [Opitutaceae bacterium LMO-M01]WED64118.1 hypothetical protein PXH66_17410 [Opitutaceae bacterium LMO-M01]